jgi:phenylacetate-CoA ligase
MKKQFLKSIRDKMPESLKYISAPLFRYKLLQNENFRNYFSLLEKRELMNHDQILDLQFNQLKEILIHSYRYVPYYTELFNQISFDPYKFDDFKQIEKIPFLTREIITERFDKLISTNRVKNGYYIGTTGGSSGIPLRFYLDYDSIYKENAFIYYYRKRLEYNFKDKVATFRNLGDGKKFWIFNPMHNELIFSNTKLSRVTLSKYVRKINEIKPQYLNGYLSSIWYFAKLIKECNETLDLKLKGIFLISENIDIEQRDFIEEFFKVKSLTFYGHSERVVIAEEVEPYSYSFDPYYGYTEEIPLGNGEYTIVGTGFLNRTMPFIRYKTDDVCFPESKFYRIEGKRYSKTGLYGKNNEFLTGTGFILGIQVFKNIITYQFVQKERGKADMFIIVSKDFQLGEMKSIKKEIDFQTNGIIDIEIKIVDNLVLTQRGKFQKYISYVGDEE